VAREQISKALIALLSAVCLQCLPARIQAQGEDTLSTAPATVFADTSYFKAGEDDWNLVESVLKQQQQSVLVLLNRGADPDAKAEGGMTALMYSAAMGDTLMTKLLVLNGASLELAPVEGTTPLLAAVLNQQFSTSYILLHYGADPDHKDQYRGSALLYAAAIDDYEMCDLLLFYGASDTIRDKDWNTALMTATFFGHEATVDVLLQAGVDPDARDKKGNTPLMIAAQQGNREIARLLLDGKAGLERMNKLNYTPLAHAVRHKQDSMALLLIDSGANVHHQVSARQNIYDLAKQEEAKTVAALLKARGAGPSPPPDFSEFQVGWGNSFASGEYMMQVRTALVDRKRGFFAETGIDFRPLYKKVQVDQGGLLIHQYREFRWSWTLGAGKYFTLFHDQTGFEYGAYAALYSMLSIPSYRGVEDSPNVNFSLAPSAGLFMQGDIAGFKVGTERYTFGTLYEQAWKINITIYIRIINHKSREVQKEIRYE
jgi:ankyrin repeat protein